MLLVGQEAFTVTSTAADFYEIDRVDRVAQCAKSLKVPTLS